MEFNNERSVTMTQELLQIIRARQKLKTADRPSRMSGRSHEISKDQVVETAQRKSQSSHETSRNFETETPKTETSHERPKTTPISKTKSDPNQIKNTPRESTSRDSKSSDAKSRQHRSEKYSTSRASRSDSEMFPDYTSLMVEEMSTEDYIYDLKLRKYIRDIQLCKRVFKKRMSISNTSSEEKDKSLAEKIEDSRKNGTSLSDLKCDSRSTASKTINDSNRFDNYVKRRRSLSTQTHISCLNQTTPHISSQKQSENSHQSIDTSKGCVCCGRENTILFLVPKYLLEEYSNRILDQVNEGDDFVNEINSIRRTLQKSLTEPDFDVREDLVSPVSTKDCATNTDSDKLFKRLRESDPEKLEDGFSDDYLQFIQGLFNKNKDVTAKVESRWPKGHKHHTVSEEDTITQCLVLADDNRTAPDCMKSHKENTIISTSPSVMSDPKPFNVRQNSLFFRYKKGHSKNWQKKLRNRKEKENASKIAREKLVWRAYMDPFYTLVHDDEYYFEIWLQSLTPKCNYT